MTWFRVDNRLIHGQIIEGWLPYLNASELIVGNDALAEDLLQQEIMLLAVPSRILVRFIPLSRSRKTLEHLNCSGGNGLFLFSNCQDAARVVAEQGVRIPLLNIGNLHYGKGKEQLAPHVAVSENDKKSMRFLIDSGTTFDFRSVPGDDYISVEGW